MNILIVHEIDWLNKVIFEPHHLAELFSMQGHQVFVIDCAEPNSKDFIKGMYTRIIPNYFRVYNDANITIIRPSSLLVKGVNRITHFLSCKKIIEKTIHEKKIDIILLYGAITNGIQTIQVAQKKNIPVIYRLLDISHGLINIPIIKHIAKRLENKVIKNANLVLTTTKDLRRYAIEMGARENNVEMFPLGVNFQDFKPMKKSLELKKELGIEEKNHVIIFVGTLYTFAGLELLIKKYSSFERNTKIIIIGGGPNFNRIKSLVQSKKLEKHVILLGFIPQNQIAKYIALADICINPFEINYVTNRILPTKILEYFACGKPVLSTPLRGTKELLPNEGYGIIYSESNNFVETLSNFLQDKNKLEKLGNLGYSYVKEIHDWEILTDKLLEKFQVIIKTHS